MLYDCEGNQFTIINLLNLWVQDDNYVVFTPENLITNKEDALQRINNYDEKGSFEKNNFLMTSKNYINHSFYKNEILKEMNKINHLEFLIPYKEDLTFPDSEKMSNKVTDKMSNLKISNTKPQFSIKKTEEKIINQEDNPFNEEDNIQEDSNIVSDEEDNNQEDNLSSEEEEIKPKFAIPKVKPSTSNKKTIDFKFPKTVDNPTVSGVNPFIEPRSSTKMEIPSNVSSKKQPNNPFATNSNEINANSQFQFNNAGIPGINSFKPKQTFVPTSKPTTSTRGKRGVVKTPDQHLIDLFANPINADKALDLSKYSSDGKVTKVKASTGTGKSRSTKIYSTLFPQIKSDNWEGVFVFFANLSPEIFSELLPILMDLANCFQRSGKMVSNYDDIMERFNEEGNPIYHAQTFIMPVSDNNLIDNKKPSFQGGTPLTSNIQLPKLPKSSNTQNFSFANLPSMKHKA